MINKEFHKTKKEIGSELQDIEEAKKKTQKSLKRFTIGIMNRFLDTCIRELTIRIWRLI